MIKDPAKTVQDICDQIAKFTDIAVIGLSGGADSTLITCLSSIALGKQNVHVVHMPYGVDDFNGNRFNARSLIIANHLEVNSKMVFIKDTVDALAENFNDITPLNLGNIKARIRMATLYSSACEISEQHEGEYAVRVIGTGNMSEDFIGYDTKGGDALADVFPIGELYKSEVYQLLDYFVEIGKINSNMIDRVPSAGLWDGQTDEDELGYTYDEMEPTIREHMISGSWYESLVGTFVKERHLANKHKHEAPKVFKIIKD